MRTLLEWREFPNAMETEQAGEAAPIKKDRLAGDNLITPIRYEEPACDMEMRIMINNLETEAEFKKCYPFKKVQCYNGKLAW
eukprot:13269629-Heterocapsa_arctica.AAC.1